MSSLHPRIAEIIAELRHAQQEMDAVMASLPVDAAARTAKEGGWSIATIVEHLAITEDNFGRLLGSMLKQLEGTVDTETDPIIPTMARFQAWQPIVKVQAPEVAMPTGTVPLQESIPRQAASRQRLLAALENGSGRALQTMSRPHPFFGVLNGYQWALLGAQHQRRHLVQIANILESDA
jgi:hypothetical protein